MTRRKVVRVMRAGVTRSPGKTSVTQTSASMRSGSTPPVIPCGLPME